MVMQLSVVYDSNPKLEVDSALDKKIEATLKPLGFERWASGMDMCNGKRDLAFERKG